MTYNYNFCKNAYPYTFVSSCAIVAPRAIVATHINVYPYSIVAPQAIEMSIIIIKLLLAFSHCRLPDPNNNKAFFFYFSDCFTLCFPRCLITDIKRGSSAGLWRYLFLLSARCEFLNCILTALFAALATCNSQC